MRFAAMLVAHLPVRVESLLEPSRALKPLVILRQWDERVMDASPEIVAVGISLGDSHRRVEQLCPHAIILPAREDVYLAHHEKLRDVLLNFANAVETSALGEMFIEVGTLGRTFPSEKALALHIATQAQRDTRLLPTAGIASNKFTAAQAARLAAQETSRALVVPDGQERTFLEALPLSALPNPPAELLRRLHVLFGITTLGGFAQLPHAAVVLQFGADMALYHDLARGIDPRPLTPQAPPPMITRTLTLPDPLADRRLVLNALEHLAGQLARALDRSGYHAAGLLLIVSTTDGHEQIAGSPLKPPSSDTSHIRRLAGRLLGKLSIAAEVSELSLTAYPLREWHAGARQLEMFEPAINPKLARLQETVRRLWERFGEAIVRLASVIGPPLPLPIQVRAQASGKPAWLSWAGWSREVAHIFEYWRKETGWWDQPMTRDYYQIETKEGSVFTVFQDDRGRWYLDRTHG